jgi:hypothetical protein
MKNFESDKDVNRKKNYKRYPEGRALKAFHLNRSRCNPLLDSAFVSALVDQLHGDQLGRLKTGPSNLDFPFCSFGFVFGHGNFDPEQSISPRRILGFTMFGGDYGFSVHVRYDIGVSKGVT